MKRINKSNMLVCLTSDKEAGSAFGGLSPGSADAVWRKID